MIMASLVVTEKMCCRCCLSDAETYYASSHVTAFIASLGFKRILVRSGKERSLLILTERVSNNFPGVELALITSPEGDHAANGLAEVGVREIKTETGIFRSQAGTPTRESDRRGGSADAVGSTTCSKLCFQVQTDGRRSHA